jgi:cytochrome c oxidase subunit 2
MAATRMTLAGVLLLALSGCGGNASSSGVSSRASSVPSYITEPFSHQEQLVAQGARLVVSDGCAACHLLARKGKPIAPSFASLAGHRVTLSDGRTVLVEERFLHEALLDPSRTSIKGYDPTPMLAALRRLHLSSEPQQVAALIAFIEQVGPESE